MPNWIDEQVAYARYADLRRREQQLALSAAMIGGWQRAPRFYGPVLARFGHQLALWGVSLEQRYSPPLESCSGATS